MKFQLRDAFNESSNSVGTVWLPALADSLEATETNCAITLHDERRVVLSGLLHLAETFTKEADVRAKLGQDCVAFTYAWESQEDISDMNFPPDGMSAVSPYSLRLASGEVKTPPPTRPGEIVFTANASRYKPRYIENGAHFMVHANVDDGEPLYISKFGSIGPIILTTLAQSLSIFPAQTIGIASNFRKNQLLQQR